MPNLKQKNNKGFTLMEVLTTIIILSILVAIAVPAYNTVVRRNKEKTYNSKKNLVILAAEKYATDENLTGVTTISVNRLIESGYLSGDKANEYKIVNDVNNDDMKCYTVTIDMTNEVPETVLNETENCAFMQSEIASDIIVISAWSGNTFSFADFESDPSKYKKNVNQTWFNNDLILMARLKKPTPVAEGAAGYDEYVTKLNYYNEFKTYAYISKEPTPVAEGQPGYEAYLEAKALYDEVTNNKDKITVRWIGNTVSQGQGDYAFYAPSLLAVASGLEDDVDTYTPIDALSNLQLFSPPRTYQADCKNCLLINGSSFYKQTYTVEFIHENGHILRKTFTVNVDKDSALAEASVNPNWEDGGLTCDKDHLDNCVKKIKITGSDKNASGLSKVAIREINSTAELEWNDFPHDEDVTKNKYEVNKPLGTYNIFTQDYAGNISAEPADTITIDKIDVNPPEIISLSASTTEWTNQPVTLTGRVIDSESGLKSYLFHFNNLIQLAMNQTPFVTNQEQNVTQEVPATLFFEGETEWYLHTKDNVGRYTLSTDVVKTKIDITHPNISFSYADGYLNPNNFITVTATCNDNNKPGKDSGVKSITLVKIGGGTVTSNTGTASINIDTVGNNQTVTATCTDNAGNVTTVNSNAYTLYNVTATFIANGATNIGSTSDSCISYNNKTCTLTSPTITRNNWVIGGWGTSANDTTSDWTIGTEKQLSVSATYYAITSKLVTITFDNNGAVSISNSILSCTMWNTNSSCAITAPTITRTSWTIVGWGTSSGDTTSDWNVGTVKLVSNNTTYYAITSKVVTITFNVNGAAGNNSNLSCTMWNTAASCSINSPTITRSSWTIVGWGTTTGDTTSDWNAGAAKLVSADATYYAITSKVVTITFNVNGAAGSNSNSSCTMWNTAASCSITSPTITRSGYTITGWGTSTGDTTSDWSQNTAKNVSADTTYYAITSKAVTINFEENGATSIGSSSLSCAMWNTAASCSITSPTITRSGYTIVGWGVSTGDTTNDWSVGTAKSVSATNTYYAITYKTVTISFNKNGATSISSTSESCTIRNTATSCSVTSPTITKTNGEGVGWGTSVGDTTSDWNQNIAKNVSANATYYAIWRITVCTHEFGSSLGAVSDEYTNYVALTYYWEGTWVCTAGHTHYTYDYLWGIKYRRTGYFMRCIHCGETAYDLREAGKISSGHATLWCTCGTSLADQGCP